MNVCKSFPFKLGCDFADKNGDCTQPTIALELCYKKQKITLNTLKKLYDVKFAQAGDTEEDFYKWAINYLVNEKGKDIKIIQEIKRHLKGIEKAVEKLEK